MASNDKTLCAMFGVREVNQIRTSEGTGPKKVYKVKGGKIAHMIYRQNLGGITYVRTK